MRSPRVNSRLAAAGGSVVEAFSSDMGVSSLILRACSSFAASMLSGDILPVSSLPMTELFSLIFFPRSSCVNPSFSRAWRILVLKSSIISCVISTLATVFFFWTMIGTLADGLLTCFGIGLVKSSCVMTSPCLEHSTQTVSLAPSIIAFIGSERILCPQTSQRNWRFTCELSL